MEKYNAEDILKKEIVRILSNNNDITFEEICNQFDQEKYPSKIISAMKDNLWQLYHSKVVYFEDEEITPDTIIHLN